MRKITSSVLIMLVSVLTVWGQNTEITYDNAMVAIEGFKKAQPTIINQAKASDKITETDKANANNLLTATFQNLDKVMSVYQRVESDEQLTNEVQKIVSDFIKEYSNAILDTDKRNISIESKSFMNVAEKYSPEFDEFYTKAQDYINQIDTLYLNEPDKYANEPADGNGEEVLKDGSESSVLVWIDLGIGILSLLLYVSGLVLINRKNKHRIKIIEQKLDDVKQMLGHKTTQTEPPSNIRTISSYTPPRQSIHQQKTQQINVPTPVPSVHREDETPRLPEVERPATSYLYATVKALSPYAEFFKVASENSGDKVFMLTLANPDADVAEFTIAPNMSPDFMKSVIIDRDTYLPSLFCEKSIDSSNPSRIEVNSVGQAKKTDGKWHVQERMVIRLV